MKIQLPSGEKIVLDENLTIEEKKEIVINLTDEWDLHILNSSRDSKPVGYFLDGLANYLVWHKEEEQKNKQDKEVLSIKKVEQMSGKRKANTIPFSSLSATQKENLGVDGDSQ